MNLVNKKGLIDNLGVTYDETGHIPESALINPRVRKKLFSYRCCSIINCVFTIVCGHCF